MGVTVRENINAPVERVWAVITDIENAADNISAINSIKVLDRPAEGVVGLKWEEVRTMFGKEATETMWISSAEAPSWYETTAHNHGAIYNTRMGIEKTDNGSEISMQFSCKATTLGSRLMTMISFLFNGAIRKALQQDLSDIKKVAEAKH